MKIVDDFAEVPAFEIDEPTGPSVPVVFNAPHSGTHYPRDLVRRSRLDRMTLRRSEDTFVDTLFKPVTALGAPLVRANFPRVYVDLNRDASELDPTMFSGPLAVSVNADTPRVAGGLGVIARVVGERQEIYDATLPAEEATFRLNRFYHPYHSTLAARLGAEVSRFGVAVLVDCHSMPSGAVRTLDDTQQQKPDIILGDRYGTSCAPQLTDELARLLSQAGLLVGRNRPYAGGFITEHFGRPPTVHAVQIEINRALYMNETTYRQSTNYAALQHALMEAFASLIGWFMASLPHQTLPLAAE